MSLRSRLVAGFIAVALALVGADLAVAVLVRHQLVRAVDQQLTVPRGTRLASGGQEAATSTPVPPTLVTPPVSEGPEVEPPGGIPGNQRFFRTFSGFYVESIDSSGKVTDRLPATVGRISAPPRITPAIAERAAPVGQTPKPFNLSAVSGGYGYRAVAFHSPRGGIVVIAESLRGTIETVDKVIGVEAIASLLVLVALGTVAWWLLHLGLRPLDEMTRMAEAIAGGDLSRRVERADTRTESGRLGHALNDMMSQIEQSFDERRASEDRLRRFVADASHELRTPLTSIRGYAELWRQGGLREEGELADAMRRMEQEGARMGTLVDEMLLLARLDQGRPLERRDVDLGVLVADAVADARAVEPTRIVELEVEPDVVVSGDEARLRQVIGNVLANVRDHTPPATPVHVRVSRGERRAVIEVEDEGTGLGPEPARVFERFYRADPSRSRAHGGAGLGLSIVAAVVEAHGGRATAGSSACGGALIRVEIPFA